MERYRHREELEFVHQVFNSLPERIKELLKGTHFIIGYRPDFLGLHFDDPDFYSQRAHCGYDFNQVHFPTSARRTTLVFPSKLIFCSVTVLHELGHALHWELVQKERGNRWEYLYDLPLVLPLTAYAETNNLEAFATAFQAWTTECLEKPIWGYTTKTDLLEYDPATYHFFEKLKRGE